MGEGLTSIGSSAFADCKLQSITFPSTVMEICMSAFIRCTNLWKVVLSDGLKKINQSVFQECTSLQSIAIPSTIEEIGNLAFNNCRNLREVVMSDGLKKIGHGVFNNCSSLECINIPSTVIEIGKFAFNTCRRLREVALHNEEVQIDDKSFYDCSSLGGFKFPSLFTRLNNIIQAGQRGIEAKMDDISAVEWRDGELSIPAMSRSREIESLIGGAATVVMRDIVTLDYIVRLIRYYEMKVATTLFELALWKAMIDQAEGASIDRGACRIEVPGPVKDSILQYL